jgi:hypothetical protein
MALHVQLTHGIHHLALLLGADFFRGGEIHDGISRVAQRHALISRGQNTAAPQHSATTRPTRPALQHHEARQVVAFAAEAVGDPRAHAGPAKEAAAGVHVELGGRVIEEIGFAGGDNAEVINDFRRVRQMVADPGTALAVLLKTNLRAQ